MRHESKRTGPRWCEGIAVAVVAAYLSLASATGHSAEHDGSQDERRNIVFILTDDQRFDVNSHSNAIRSSSVSA